MCNTISKPKYKGSLLYTKWPAAARGYRATGFHRPKELYFYLQRYAIPQTYSLGGYVSVRLELLKTDGGEGGKRVGSRLVYIEAQMRRHINNTSPQKTGKSGASIDTSDQQSLSDTTYASDIIYVILAIVGWKAVGQSLVTELVAVYVYISE